MTFPGIVEVSLAYKSRQFSKGAPGRFVYVCKLQSHPHIYCHSVVQVIALCLFVLFLVCSRSNIVMIAKTQTFAAVCCSTDPDGSAARPKMLPRSDQKSCPVTKNVAHWPKKLRNRQHFVCPLINYGRQNDWRPFGTFMTFWLSCFLSLFASTLSSLAARLIGLGSEQQLVGCWLILIANPQFWPNL